MPSRKFFAAGLARSPADGFERGGGGVMCDRTRASQARMRQKFRTHGRVRHQPRAQRFVPAGPRHRLHRQWFAFVQRFAQGGDIPASGRNRADARNENPAHAHLLKIKVALTPPKPNELDSATFTARVLRFVHDGKFAGRVGRFKRDFRRQPLFAQASSGKPPPRPRPRRRADGRCWLSWN